MSFSVSVLPDYSIISTSTPLSLSTSSPSTRKQANQSANMQIKNILVLALASFAAVRIPLLHHMHGTFPTNNFQADDIFDKIGDGIDNIGDDVRDIFDDITSDSGSFWTSIRSEASSVASSFSSGMLTFFPRQFLIYPTHIYTTPHSTTSKTAQLTSPPTEYSQFTATASAGAEATSYIQSLESAASSRLASISSVARTHTRDGNVVAATTVTTTNAAGQTITSTSLSTAAAALPTGAVGAMLFGGAAVFAAVL
ncbi:hypothetical protein BKA65DRAFT_499720 [Rhexocercosporidium sp. MPI-PUGE-AT-0058]|nr:hypothetical protein BKA65DRAFT_499720 [Rhexocercosporidium sp. MPI-PUGE-AT-0058]